MKDMLSSTRNRSLIAIQDFDHSAVVLPSLSNEPLVSTAAMEMNRHSNSTSSTKKTCSTVTETKDASDSNRAYLGRAYQSDPIMFNSENEDEGEVLSEETMSLLSFDDPTKQKLLPDRTSLTLFPEMTSQNLDDFDHCSAMLPDLNDELPATTAVMEVNRHC